MFFVCTPGYPSWCVYAGMLVNDLIDAFLIISRFRFFKNMKKSLSFFFLTTALCAVAFSLFGQNNNVQLRSTLSFPGQSLANICGYWKDGREYALVGANKGLIIVEVTNPDQPVQIVQIPGPVNDWKEIKTLGHYCYVTSEGGQGVQIVDLSGLPSPSLQSKFYTGDGDIAGRLNRIHALHIDTTARYLYAFGSNLFSGGAVVLDLNDPYNPTYAGKFDALGYIHDGYVDNDTLFAAHIYTGTLSAVDMHDKSKPVVIGTTQTPSRFTHNAWLTGDRKHILTTDERTPSFVTAYDISDLTNMSELDRISTNDGTQSIGHNTHVINDYAVTSWYSDGFTIVDAHRPDNLIEVGRYDTWAPATTNDFFVGCWGVYPFLPSGTIVASNIDPAELYVVTPTYKRAAYLEGIVKDEAALTPLAGVEVDVAASGKKDLTRADGSFKTGHAEAGQYKIRVSKLGYYPKEITVDLQSAQVKTVEILLQKSPVVTFAGKVAQDAVGNPPVENARLHITGNGIDSFIVTDNQGAYKINLPRADYTIDIYAWGYVSQTLFGATLPAVVLLKKDDYKDNFELDYGWWSVGDALSGLWERGKPKGTTFNGEQIAPASDSPDDSGDQCYVTGNGGGGAGDDDVDGGSVTLISPAMQLANRAGAILTFDYWFANSGGNGAPNDTFIVKAFNGLEEVVLLTHNNPKGQWRKSGDIELSNYLHLTDEMNIIFYTADAPSGHLVEAAVDNFKVVAGKLLGSGPRIEPSALLSVTPNPAPHAFQIQYEWPSHTEDLQLCMYNIQGRLIETRPLSSSKGTAQVGEQWVPGVYFAILRNGTGTQAAPIKLVKQ